MLVALNCLKKTSFIFLSLVSTSCAGTTINQAYDQTPLNPSKHYKMDLEIEINFRKAVGLFSIDQAGAYWINFKAPNQVDIVTIQTCHREIILRKQNAEFRFQYIPNEIENSGFCPMIIKSFDPSFRYASAMIDFKESGMKAILYCNGEKIDNDGASVCQSHDGLIQQIAFPDEVLAAPPSPQCGQISKVSGNKYEVRLSPGLCVYVFKGRSGTHRLVTYGYQEFQIRK